MISGSGIEPAETKVNADTLNGARFRRNTHFAPRDLNLLSVAVRPGYLVCLSDALHRGSLAQRSVSLCHDRAHLSSGRFPPEGHARHPGFAWNGKNQPVAGRNRVTGFFRAERIRIGPPDRGIQEFLVVLECHFRTVGFHECGRTVVLAAAQSQGKHLSFRRVPFFEIPVDYDRNLHRRNRRLAAGYPVPPAAGISKRNEQEQEYCGEEEPRHVEPENGHSCRGILKEFLNRRFRVECFAGAFHGDIEFLIGRM